jgi:hypothetical protein
MKIIILTGHFFPEIHPRAFRSFELAQEFSRRGHDVTVICLRKYQLFSIEEFNNNHSFSIITIPFFFIKLLNNYSESNSKNILKKIKFFLEYFFGGKLLLNSFKLFFKLKKNIDADLFITLSTPFFIHLGTSFYIRLKRKKNKKKTIFFADCGDPYSNSNQFPKPFYFKFVEKFALKPFDNIFVPSILSISAYDKIVDLNKIKIIPQGFKIKDYTYNYKKQDLIKFSYAGVFYWDIRNPINLLNKLNETSVNFKFVIFLRNYDQYFINNILSKYPDSFKSKVEINYGFSREELLIELSKMDFLINISNTTLTQVPSKLIDYAISGRPILEISPSDKFLNNLDDFIEGDYSGQVKINLDQYDIENLCDEILLLHQVHMKI